jgi:RNA polymerase sigma-70 factor (ECF subfamily)
MKPVEEFEDLALPLRRELIAHCYRMVGSADEAEDLVQETYLRAWRSYGQFEGRSSLRTWLYRIATNVCLQAIERRGRRPLPSGLGPPDDDPSMKATPALDIPWLQPLVQDPAAVVASRTGLRLALIAGLQYLSARQRAVLILRDVLDWPAAEAAGALGMTTTAVNSSLRRARARLDQVMPDAEDIGEPSDPRWRDLANRYAAAFEAADLAALVTLLRDDVTLEMPPMARWFTGTEAVTAFLSAQVMALPGRPLLTPTVANGQPAFATYLVEVDGIARAHAIQVLDVADGKITRIVIFLDTGLFTTFGLPLVAAAP